MIVWTVEFQSTEDGAYGNWRLYAPFKDEQDAKWCVERNRVKTCKAQTPHYYVETDNEFEWQLAPGDPVYRARIVKWTC